MRLEMGVIARQGSPCTTPTSRALIACALALFAGLAYAQQPPQGCARVQMTGPVPFLGTADETVTLSDGSVWKDVSYKSLNLYLYRPTVVICPGQSVLYVDNPGGKPHTFYVTRLR